MSKKEQKKVCESCGGTGQAGFFKGVSRFLLSYEECEECAGTGFQLNYEKVGTNKVEKATRNQKK